MLIHLAFFSGNTYRDVESKPNKNEDFIIKIKDFCLEIARCARDKTKYNDTAQDGGRRTRKQTNDKHIARRWVDKKERVCGEIKYISKTKRKKKGHTWTFTPEPDEAADEALAARPYTRISPSRPRVDPTCPLPCPAFGEYPAPSGDPRSDSCCWTAAAAEEDRADAETGEGKLASRSRFARVWDVADCEEAVDDDRTAAAE